MSDNEPIRYSLEDGIATITIDRPARKNALSVEAMNGLTNAWERVERDSQARVVILTSADCGVFSAGLDLRQAAEIRARDGVDILTLMRDPMQTAMRTVSKPIIAAMTGSLMAGGMLLALKCDLRIGLRGTRAGITEVKMGRGSPWAVPLLWMLPQPVVMELVLTGETLPIERLAEYGFVNYLEETPDAVRARALQLARKIVEGAPLSVRAAKASVLAAMDLGCEKGLVEANRLHVEAYASLDAIEGPRAFAEKRKPVWQGK
ncbi:enoyl-CoA hydratase/isomerase family protein [Bradyrhizobium viridifuturi]|jgi:enoyl-CoA hydratase|uniref:enoyl-CoA hydratase/isomerase family protein n=1 Tax=unclassified Bradyrhizobium TaxID=2631580 RepID=UPI000396BB5C|nr:MULTISPECIES: enoyl-CoA hydratase-related protein [unclassified Bradyrhizobium]ERF86591.1 MAG: 5-methyltetrahydrofolate-homocysteine methyltransferase [Bradyrhizobium sp. DFCI-1]MBR1037848.1 enoyl-CoA hydratase/isomerase family protein [Bradyrhizobium viridifuturi]MBR2119719.1 enoyl-CoA hydratase/isomerase family protein [Afipia sp.]MBS0528311.1 enoyl-CoA hydratase/isomerase family protein [Pseudomonadota bacterium]MCA3793465.1 enoyl-CoA hydratase/isomerase family protein [Burkholderia sp.]